MSNALTEVKVGAELYTSYTQDAERKAGLVKWKVKWVTSHLVGLQYVSGDLNCYRRDPTLNKETMVSTGGAFKFEAFSSAPEKKGEFDVLPKMDEEKTKVKVFYDEMGKHIYFLGDKYSHKVYVPELKSMVGIKVNHNPLVPAETKLYNIVR